MSRRAIRGCGFGAASLVKGEGLIFEWRSENEVTFKLDCGCWVRFKVTQDPCGVWHFDFNKGGGTIDDAAKGALLLIERTDMRPGWLWFNGFPIPLSLKFTPAEICQMYHGSVREGRRALECFKKFRDGENQWLVADLEPQEPSF